MSLSKFLSTPVVATKIIPRSFLNGLLGVDKSIVVINRVFV